MLRLFELADACGFYSRLELFLSRPRTNLLDSMLVASRGGGKRFVGPTEPWARK